ncbi:terminase small subunit [Alcanivorax sp. DP30]|uniref:terminase small subunit n=1 Tax=Alcanivorax sp. DP30 TaxID=2606217 RepID=UPI00136EF8DA|nr:terminase small subunit [Alcanivorax sp. DP30]
MLNSKQQLFVEEYLKDLNGTQAAIRAGYSPNRADQTASRLLRNGKVKSAVEKAKAQRSERTKVDADYVLKRLHQIDTLDVTDILDNTGNMLPIREWPKAWRQSISGVDLQELMSGDTETVVRKIKWPDKLRNLELLGKHVNVKAFEEDKDGGVEDMAAALEKLADKLPG